MFDWPFIDDLDQCFALILQTFVFAINFSFNDFDSLGL